MSYNNIKRKQGRDLEVGKGFLTMAQIPEAIREKMDKFNH